MTFYVEDETESKFSFDTYEIVKNVAGKVLETENCPYETEVNVLITDNAGIREFNRQYRDIDRETDVLSFPNLIFAKASDFEIPENMEADFFNPETGELILGDIIISSDKVREQAKSFGHSELREFAFLVAHSMFHLCGYDHMTKEEAQIMERKQEEVLLALEITREK